MITPEGSTPKHNTTPSGSVTMLDDLLFYSHRETTSMCPVTLAALCDWDSLAQTTQTHAMDFVSAWVNRSTPIFD